MNVIYLTQLKGIFMNSVIYKTLAKVFPTLSEAHLQKVFESGRMIYSEAKTQITGPHDGDHSMYICISGVVKVNYESDTGEELSILYLSNGELFGELSAIDEKPRSAYCIAKTDCSLLKIPAEAVRNLMDNDKGFNQAIMRTLIERIRNTDKKLYSVGLESATVRIIGEILRLAEPTSDDQPDEMEVPFAPTHKELALLAIVSREQTSRTVKKLENAGLIEKRDGRLFIPSAKVLKEHAI